MMGSVVIIMTYEVTVGFCHRISLQGISKGKVQHINCHEGRGGVEV